MFRNRVLRAVQQSKLRSSGFGSPAAHEPHWVEKFTANHRAGKDSLDWFFRAFNSTGIYETFLKSSPRFYGFMVCGGIVLSYYWSRMWDHVWDHINQGKLYRHVPYVYPPADDDE